MNVKTEHQRAVATDIDFLKKQWYMEGVEAGAEFERTRVRAVQDQAMPGHEALVETLKFDGHTTGEQAAVLILAAERKKLGAYADDLRTAPAPPPTEITTRTTTQEVDATMTPQQIELIAQEEWANNPNLSREFTSLITYVAFRKAEAAGRIRVLKRKVM
jgi:hypothetical protein